MVLKRSNNWNVSRRAGESWNVGESRRGGSWLFQPGRRQSVATMNGVCWGQDMFVIAQNCGERKKLKVTVSTLQDAFCRPANRGGCRAQGIQGKNKKRTCRHRRWEGGNLIAQQSHTCKCEPERLLMGLSLGSTAGQSTSNSISTAQLGAAHRGLQVEECGSVQQAAEHLGLGRLCDSDRSVIRTLVHVTWLPGQSSPLRLVPAFGAPRCQAACPGRPLLCSARARLSRALPLARAHVQGPTH